MNWTKQCAFLLAAVLVVAMAVSVSAEEDPAMDLAIESIPEGYYLYAYDDCGVRGRQPHVVGDACEMMVAGSAEDYKYRTVAYGNPDLDMVYDNLESDVQYILAVTYLTQPEFPQTIQTLTAGKVLLHGPCEVPVGNSKRLILNLPADAVKDGKLHLHFTRNEGWNAMVSIVELWATEPPNESPLRLYCSPGFCPSLIGTVQSMAYDPVGNAQIKLTCVSDGRVLAAAKTDADGSFSFPKQVLEAGSVEGDLKVTAVHDGREVSRTIPAADLRFDPVRYRPIPSKVKGLQSNTLFLDGDWWIKPTQIEKFREESLGSDGWGRVKVPGQWLQQGYDLPQDKPVAMGKEFTVPEEWAGYRIFLRFDAIHAGTHYWLNGKKLGYSESLFTPVEWEITESVRPGEKNRLDLEMKVDTLSEKLSCSCSYAHHNLGGIDRAVRLYALPQVHVKHMYLTADLDEAYRDGKLSLRMTLDNTRKQAEKDLALRISLYGPDGKKVTHSVPKFAVDILYPGTREIEVDSHVAKPLQWNAEKPFLYKMVMELAKGNTVLERIERNIGFRKVEIKEKQLYVNGKRVKLAGICHHEIDPLAGRADTMCHAEQDIKLLKSASFNNLRTAHYPPTMELVETADRLGMYVELEAPFCWVQPSDELRQVDEILTPTSAMVDYYYSNPSVIIWSLANESHFIKEFELAHTLCKDLDPTRLTTFDSDWTIYPEKVCDTVNLHYAQMPYDEDERSKDDPRPYLIAEYFPLIQILIGTDVNPGLRELTGHGFAEPDSDWGKKCADIRGNGDKAIWGAKPGAWSYIYNSDHVIGADVWSAIDEPFYLPGGKHAGYAFVFGYWGVVDAWRRPKPEWWLSKLIFSPVWFPSGHVDFHPGQKSIRVPVENRYSFTNLSELDITWEWRVGEGASGSDIPPHSAGEIEIPVPKGVQEGDKVILRVTDAQGELVNARAITLGNDKTPTLPEPNAGIPKWADDGKKISVQGNGFSLALDRATGDFDAGSPEHIAPMLHFPSLYISLYDQPTALFGDKYPYGEFPDASTRKIENVTARGVENGLELVIQDSYKGFEGSVRWLIDKNGMGKVSYDYTYSGEGMEIRESGVKFRLKPECDEVKWRRWSEWGIYPEDSISRTEGSAKARRGSQQGRDTEGIRPTWEWRLDQTELGTADFRSVKLNIYESSLTAPDGSGMAVYAKADAHVRPALAEQGVDMHVLSQCLYGPLATKAGDRIAGEFVVQIVGSGTAR